MSYAIIETGGKQLRVEPGRFYDIELLAIEPEETLAIDKVLMVCHEGEVHIGQPYVEGAIVDGTVLRHFRGRKVIIYKMRPKKKTRKKRGHRQEQTRFMIDAIRLNGLVLAMRQDIDDLAEDDEVETSLAKEVIDVIAVTAVEETEAVEEVEEIIDPASDDAEAATVPGEDLGVEADSEPEAREEE